MNLLVEFSKNKLLKHNLFLNFCFFLRKNDLFIIHFFNSRIFINYYTLILVFSFLANEIMIQISIDYRYIRGKGILIDSITFSGPTIIVLSGGRAKQTKLFYQKT